MDYKDFSPQGIWDAISRLLEIAEKSFTFNRKQLTFGWVLSGPCWFVFLWICICIHSFFTFVNSRFARDDQRDHFKKVLDFAGKGLTNVIRFWTLIFFARMLHLSFTYTGEPFSICGNNRVATAVQIDVCMIRMVHAAKNLLLPYGLLVVFHNMTGVRLELPMTNTLLSCFVGLCFNVQHKKYTPENTGCNLYESTSVQVYVPGCFAVLALGGVLFCYFSL